jgi:hypothetical protein
VPEIRFQKFSAFRQMANVCPSDKTLPAFQSFRRFKEKNTTPRKTSKALRCRALPDHELRPATEVLTSLDIFGCKGFSKSLHPKIHRQK